MVEYNYMYPYMAKAMSNCKRRAIKVNGRGSVNAIPDMAIVSVGAVTEDKNPQNAQNQNDIIINNIISALLSLGIPKENIKTQTYSIFPEYDYVEGKQILRGYKVTHILQIKVENIDQVGTVINTAVANGANQINNVEFTLKDSAKYYNKALKLAVADAEGKADAIAMAMKVSLDVVPCTVTEQSTSFTPLTQQTTMKVAAEAPVMPGELEITASIEAEFLYY